MQPIDRFFPVLSFLGVLAQLGGAVALVSLFLLLRRFVLRRAYFSAWVAAWGALAVAIAALAVRYFLVPGVIGTSVPETAPVVRLLYFVYQACKGLGFAFFIRGALLYVTGGVTAVGATRNVWIAAVAFAVISTIASRDGLNEMVIWQSVVAVPALGYCASSFAWLPPGRRTRGTLATSACFALLAGLWLVYAGAFAVYVRGIHGPLATWTAVLVDFNSYFDLTLNVMLAYSMILVLMEDARREFDDAQAELAVTHNRLRRAALYDPLTDSLNRSAFAEGVGLEMVRATFGTAVLADLDNLKVVNDRHGHAAGDLMLRRCADAIRATLRSYDRLYRWGGDEFLVIVPSAYASEVLARLQTAIADTGPVEVPGAGEPIRVEVSLGASDFASIEDLSNAIERADRAMYREKSRRKADAGIPPESRTPLSAPAVR